MSAVCNFLLFQSTNCKKLQPSDIGTSGSKVIQRNSAKDCQQIVPQNVWLFETARLLRSRQVWSWRRFCVRNKDHGGRTLYSAQVSLRSEGASSKPAGAHMLISDKTSCSSLSLRPLDHMIFSQPLYRSHTHKTMMCFSLAFSLFAYVSKYST